MSDSKTLVDYRFVFKDGHEEFVSTVEGRDQLDTADPSMWSFTLHHEDGATEAVVIYPAHLLCWRQATRVITLEPEDTQTVIA